jgi:hypothetical protein
VEIDGTRSFGTTAENIFGFLPPKLPDEIPDFSNRSPPRRLLARL